MEEFVLFQAVFSDCATVTHTLGSCLLLSGSEKWVQQDTALSRGQVARARALKSKLWLCFFPLHDFQQRVGIYVCALAQGHGAVFYVADVEKYLVEIYSASGLRKYFCQEVIHFSVRTGKTIQQIFSGNMKT